MILPFAGKTLVDVCLEKVKKSKLIKNKNFFFSVYEEELKSIASKHGINVWNRSYESSNSEGTPLTELFDWWNKLNFKYAIIISACCPLLKVNTIDGFIDSFLNSNSEGMLSVIERKNYFWDDDHNLITEWPEGLEIMNTKFIKPTYETAQCLYAGRMDKIGKGIWMGDFKKSSAIALYNISEEESFDIDYPEQKDLVESLYKSLVIKD
jgi:CMP-N-acetylneuraminic acid synthetase